jgi:exopolyphosphatase / guanosine-5'-triphosphate,3'-diphosphate pyrophosphatase
VTTVAIVDIGSNSIRLLIADKTADDGITELDRQANVTRLGQGVDTSGRLADDAIERTYTVLADYAERMDKHDCDERIAVLTSAVRDSDNGEEFAQTIKERYGITPHVLKGDEEARLTYLGATSERDPADTTPTLVLDIGGGSTEMIIGAGPEVRFRVSTQAGVVRQTERHLPDDPPTEQQMDALSQDVRTILADNVPEELRSAVNKGIAVAGTATSLAAIAQHLDPYDPEKVHGYELSTDECDRILKELSAMTLQQRREVPGLHPDRAPTIIAGVLIFKQVVQLFGLKQIEVSEHDILRGAALGLTPPAAPPSSAAH